jgi:cytochrome c oxidase accessory protein FixG
MNTTDSLYQFDEEFRDSIATVDKEGKRIWIYPKKPSGHYHHRRIVVTVILLTIFFAGPFLQWNGKPFFLLNIFERKFILFGQVFWPQDFFLLALTLITFFVFIILFTVVFGRLWCGWACPQTLFMEMVFRKIEYWIEGDANEQRKLSLAPWTTSKVIKKGGKQLIFVAISILIAHVAMAYLIGIDQVREIITQPPANHWAGFIGLVVFTGIFYGVFAWFREQACIVVCPYGRLQGVLLVKNSIMVAYDWVRGEPRGKLRKQQTNPVEEKRGDCIDCKLCVHVCPTGIDIRNGTQLECVNCTACIDVCDDVMLKVNKPTGLIRYSSPAAIERGESKIINVRVISYAAMLTVLLGLLSYFIVTRSDVDTTVLKMPGTLYTRTDGGKITNVYAIEFLNKTFEDKVLDIRIESPPQATITRIGEQALNIPKEAMIKRNFLIQIPEDQLTTTRTIIHMGVYEGDRKIDRIKARFIGPIKIQPTH